MLQWGRTLSSAESSLLHHGAQPFFPASMGPHSFKCGKRAQSIDRHRLDHRFNGAALFQVRKGPNCLPSQAGIFLLQWGRTLSSAESWRVIGLRKTGEACFNGAALFQVRKDRQAKAREDLKAKLQWGRTLSSAESCRILVRHQL